MDGASPGIPPSGFGGTTWTGTVHCSGPIEAPLDLTAAQRAAARTRGASGEATLPGYMTIGLCNPVMGAQAAPRGAPPALEQQLSEADVERVARRTAELVIEPLRKELPR